MQRCMGGEARNRGGAAVLRRGGDERGAQAEQRGAQAVQAVYVFVLADERRDVACHGLEEREVVRVRGADYVAEDDEEGAQRV